MIGLVAFNSSCIHRKLLPGRVGPNGAEGEVIEIAGDDGLRAGLIGGFGLKQLLPAAPPAAQNNQPQAATATVDVHAQTLCRFRSSPNQDAK